MDETQGIEIVGVRYAYGAKPALADVSMALRPGRFTALLGPNGAGKSTLVSLLSALFVPQDGRISIFGLDLADDPLSALAVMGIVFQQQTLDLDLSVRQNMAFEERKVGTLQLSQATIRLRRGLLQKTKRDSPFGFSSQRS